MSTRPPVVQPRRVYHQTMPMGIEDAISHVDGCRARYIAGACGGLYVCNSCERSIGRCHSHPDMPAVCVICRIRYVMLWATEPHRDLRKVV